MSLLSGIQANRAIATILSEDAAVTPEGKRALFKLKQIGEPAIPKLIEALGNAKSTATLEQLLTSLVHNNTLTTFVTSLGDGNQRIVDGVTQILKRSQDFNPNDLLPYFDDPNISKTSLGEILQTHASRVNPNTLLAHLDKADSKLRPIIYKILDKVQHILRGSNKLPKIILVFDIE